MAREWASTALRFSRSNTVCTARAPATRAMASMFQSRSRGAAADRARGAALPAGGHVRAPRRDVAEAADEPAHQLGAGGGEERPRGVLGGGAALGGNAGHGAADADAARVHAPAVAVDDAPHGDVALH